MQERDYRRWAGQGYTHVPVYRRLLADLDTPLSLYLKLADAPYSYLLESVEGGERWARYSIIGLPARRVIRVDDRRWSELRDGLVVREEREADPLAAVADLMAEVRVPRIDELPLFAGGWVGYFGYECVRYIEPRLADLNNVDELGTADLLLMFAEDVVVFDNLSGALWLITHADTADPDAYRRAQRRLDRTAFRIRAGVAPYPPQVAGDAVEVAFESRFDEAAFQTAVRRCKEYILAGDVMQVVLSQRMTAPFHARAIDVYRALRNLNPSPYMYFVDLGDAQIVGSSPEVLVRVQDGEATLRPIAGTLPRGATEAEDEQLQARLLADEKERAEHLMLIDLGRNDLGRVSVTGSVRLTEEMVVERYSHVMHIVSEVRGRLQEGVRFPDVLRAVFPAGTLSGAPKIRAMEIIAELEPIKRNIYAGAVGYVNWRGEGDTAIAIRTAVIKDGKLHVQVGAGIVADSDPAREWQETLNKGRALFHAVTRAASGL